MDRIPVIAAIGILSARKIPYLALVDPAAEPGTFKEYEYQSGV